MESVFCLAAENSGGILTRRKHETRPYYSILATVERLRENAERGQRRKIERERERVGLHTHEKKEMES